MPQRSGRVLPEWGAFWQWFFAGRSLTKLKVVTARLKCFTLRSRSPFMTATATNGRSQQQELGQFLTTDFMASMFGPSTTAPRSTTKRRWELLVKAIIKVFFARWAPGAAILGICDSERGEVHLDSDALASLGVSLDSSAKLPGVIIHHESKNRLLLVEPVIKGRPVDERRSQELQNWFAGSAAHLVFVTAFENRRAMQTFGSEIAWESEVWFAEDPDHMIHFGGKSLIGPYPDVMPSQ